LRSLAASLMMVLHNTIQSAPCVFGFFKQGMMGLNRLKFLLHWKFIIIWNCSWCLSPRVQCMHFPFVECLLYCWICYLVAMKKISCRSMDFWEGCWMLRWALFSSCCRWVSLFCRIALSTLLYIIIPFQPIQPSLCCSAFSHMTREWS
jgi:hypothetical protein